MPDSPDPRNAELEDEPAPPGAAERTDDGEQADTKPCPYCAEQIQAAATKCRYCGEWIERRCQVCGVPVRGEWAQAGRCVEHMSRAVAPARPHEAVAKGRRWSPAAAAVLSFMIPGLGQMYKGAVASGLAWMFFTLLGYVALIVPGLVLHACCVISAASGDPGERGG